MKLIGIPDEYVELEYFTLPELLEAIKAMNKLRIANLWQRLCLSQCRTSNNSTLIGGYMFKRIILLVMDSIGIRSRRGSCKIW